MSETDNPNLWFHGFLPSPKTTTVCLCSHIKFHERRWLKIDPEASTTTVGVADKPNFHEGYNAMSSLTCKRQVSHDTLFSGWETRWWNFSASVRFCPPCRVHWHQDFNSRIAFMKQNKLYEKAERLLIAPSRTVRPRQLSFIFGISFSTPGLSKLRPAGHIWLRFTDCGPNNSDTEITYI